MRRFRASDEEEGSTGCLTESLHGFEPYVLGNSGRNILDGLGLLAVDAALVKNFRFKERRGLQVRLEAFNVLNRTNLLLPNNRFNSITGGFITRTGDPGRRGRTASLTAIWIRTSVPARRALTERRPLQYLIETAAGVSRR